MRLKRFKLYQTTDGIMKDYYIGSIWATSFKMIGNVAMFSIDDTCIGAMNFVRVEVVLTDET